MAGILHTMIQQVTPYVPPPTPQVDIVSDVANVNIKSLFLANGWDGIVPLVGNLIIHPTARVYSSSTALDALFTDVGYPVGSVITIYNQGLILGRGGNGGDGGVNGGLGHVGYPGGNAFKASIAVIMYNNGLIAGGGGGGGPSIDNRKDSGGGGGGGRGGSSGGAGGAHSSGGSGSGQDGSNGTLTTEGVGGRAYWVNSGGGFNYGGNGGNYGAAGAIGDGSSLYTANRVGGAAGTAVIGNSNITWAVTGTIAGALT